MATCLVPVGASHWSHPYGGYLRFSVEDAMSPPKKVLFQPRTMQFTFQQFNIIIWKTHDFQRKMIYMASFPTFSHMGVAEVKMAGLPFPVPDLNGAGGPGSGFQL